MKKLLLVLTLLIIVSCAFGYLLYQLVDKRPEINLARKFLFKNEAVLKNFGEIKEIRLSSEHEQEVSWRNNGVEGDNIFIIEGIHKEDVVKIRWHSRGSGIGFQADSIEMLDSQGFKKIWPIAK